MSKPVQILTPDGRELTVQASSLPFYERRGCIQISEPEESGEVAMRADDEVVVPPTDTQDNDTPDAGTDSEE